MGLAVLMPLGVALSRMYRGMHHPTDVLGAAILTTLWVGTAVVGDPAQRGEGGGHRAPGGATPERARHRSAS